MRRSRASPTTRAAIGTVRSARGGARGVAGGPTSRTAAGSVLPCRLHAARADRRRSPSRTRPLSMPSCSGAGEAMTTLAANPRRLGAQDRLPRRAAHLGADADPPSPHVHCVVPGGGLSPDGTRWIDGRPDFFLAGQPAVAPVPPAVPRTPANRLRRRRDLGFFGDLAHLADPDAFARHLRRDAARRLGRLRQDAVRRPRAGPRLSRPLHASRRHRQQPPRRASTTIMSRSPGRIIATTA